MITVFGCFSVICCLMLRNVTGLMVGQFLTVSSSTIFSQKRYRYGSVVFKYSIVECCLLPLESQDAACVTVDVVNALHFLHNMGVSHRDLKASA